MAGENRRDHVDLGHLLVLIAAGSLAVDHDRVQARFIGIRRILQRALVHAQVLVGSRIAVGMGEQLMIAVDGLAHVGISTGDVDLVRPGDIP